MEVFCDSYNSVANNDEKIDFRYLKCFNSCTEIRLRNFCGYGVITLILLKDQFFLNDCTHIQKGISPKDIHRAEELNPKSGFQMCLSLTGDELIFMVKMYIFIR